MLDDRILNINKRLHIDTYRLHIDKIYYYIFIKLILLVNFSLAIQLL